jgi:hypothetical protein
VFQTQWRTEKALFRTTIGNLDYMLGQKRETAHYRYLMTWETFLRENSPICLHCMDDRLS